MTDTNRIVTIGVVAALGFAVGYSVEKDTARELKSLNQQLAAVEARVDAAASEAQQAAARAGAAESAVGRVATAVAGLDGLDARLGTLGEQLAALEAGQAAQAESAAASAEAAAGRMSEGLAALGTRVDAMAAAAETAQAALDERLAALSVPSTASAPTAAVPVPAAPVTAEVPAEAAAPESDLTLAFGETAEIEGLRVFASRMHDGDAVLRVAGLGDVTVGPSSGRAALGNGCSLSLVAAEARKLFLDTDCTGEAAPAGGAPAVIAADAAGEAFMLSPGQTAGVGEGRVFFSRVADNAAHLRVAGAGDLVLALGGDAGAVAGDCAIALDDIKGRSAAFRSNCSVDAPKLAMATTAAPEDTGSDDLIASAGPDAIVLGVGEARALGDVSVFFSRRAAGDVVLFVRGRGTVTVGPQAGSATIGGCSVSLLGMVEGKAVLKPDC
ncbi:MAG: hypothetical protein AAFP17_04655 [Pseudomonadota bacterium]